MPFCCRCNCIYLSTLSAASAKMPPNPFLALLMEAASPVVNTRAEFGLRYDNTLHSDLPRVLPWPKPSSPVVILNAGFGLASAGNACGRGKHSQSSRAHLRDAAAGALRAAVVVDGGSGGMLAREELAPSWYQKRTQVNVAA
ncbi:hypothetical protein F4775DRAFT_599430 [Biscogniauxia sp. FL1348]|nr:hypothetical protein F4775DRAFT_599430 [Biscogniauxia sp. FL1348]